MRRPATALLSLSIAALLLAGCSDSGSSDASASPSASTESTAAATASAEDVAALEAVTVEGDLGAAPTLTFDMPFSITSPVSRVDVEGEGDDLDASSIITIQYVAISGDDGTTLGSTWETDTPETLSLGDTQIISALTEVLIGHKVGTRVLFAAPGAEATDTTEAYAATVMAIEVTGVVPARAEGEAVAPVAGLPTVTLAEDGTPSVTIPADFATPTALTAQPLIKGAGAVVESGQTITVQYSGWLFDGTQFDSSWGTGSPLQTAIGTGSVITGWDQGLVGQTVGSQVLLVIPSDLAYGADGSGETIPADSPLVFVVDILAAS